MTPYRHMQIGWVNVGLFVVAAALMPLLIRESPTASLLVLALAVGAVLLFSCLRVRVDERQVTARLGVGLIGRRIPIADIQRCTPVRNLWWYGWGVRMIPGGAMYSVYGLSAVELVLSNGSRFRIGTNEPEALAGAIRAAAGRRLEPDGAAARPTSARS
jgi:hypothetical protein